MKQVQQSANIRPNALRADFIKFQSIADNYQSNKTNENQSIASPLNAYLISCKSLFHTATHICTPNVEVGGAVSEMDLFRTTDAEDLLAAAEDSAASEETEAMTEGLRCAPALRKSLTSPTCFRSTASMSGDRPKASRTCNEAPRSKRNCAISRRPSI